MRVAAVIACLALAACGAANTNDGGRDEPYIVRVAPPSGLGGPAYLWEGSDLDYVSSGDSLTDADTIQAAILDKIGVGSSSDLPLYTRPDLWFWAHDPEVVEPLTLALDYLNLAAGRIAFYVKDWEPSRP